MRCDEGDEITLTSNLKLRRGSIHSEPAIELSGADPYKFAELRELGLINEQINWKQRFFVPTDETSGIDILESLLQRYPVTLTEGAASEGESSRTEIAPETEIKSPEIVDLDQWIVAVGKQNEQDRMPDATNQESAELEPATEEPPPFMLTKEDAYSWNQFPQNEQTQLAFSFG